MCKGPRYYMQVTSDAVTAMSLRINQCTCVTISLVEPCTSIIHVCQISNTSTCNFASVADTIIIIHDYENKKVTSADI